MFFFNLNDTMIFLHLILFPLYNICIMVRFRELNRRWIKYSSLHITNWRLRTGDLLGQKASKYHVINNINNGTAALIHPAGFKKRNARPMHSRILVGLFLKVTILQTFECKGYQREQSHLKFQGHYYKLLLSNQESCLTGGSYSIICVKSYKTDEFKTMYLVNYHTKMGYLSQCVKVKSVTFFWSTLGPIAEVLLNEKKKSTS